jgi:hypothetical protein
MGCRPRWFRLSAERFDAVQYGGIAVCKIRILLFDLVPYVALTDCRVKITTDRR